MVYAFQINGVPTASRGSNSWLAFLGLYRERPEQEI
jgi:hypothetical protein